MNPADPNPEPEAPASEETRSVSEPEPSPIEPPAPAPAAVEHKAGEPVLKDAHKKDKDKDKERDKEKGKDRDKEKEKDKEKDKKKKKKEFKRAGPWERYKALLDAVKESQDLVDLADHKARFALLIMGALNAAIIILGTRSDLLSRLPPNLTLWLYTYFGVYAVIAIYFLVQAIESLRPRSIPDVALRGTVPEKEESLGLRFFVDALRYDTPTYLKAWQSVRVSQLNAELATQLHTLARINKAKYNAVAKLYLGLQAITVLTAGLLIALGVAAWVEHKATLTEVATVEPAPKIKAGKPRKGGWAILGEPERFAVAGVKEPSGIVFSPSRGTLFVVGDEGSLVEVATDGKVVAQIPTGGNLEDVAVHTPSGRLVLLSEKKGELIVLDPSTGKKTGKFKLDDVALLGEAGVDKNQGFEGLAFRKEDGRPGGGTFYLVHQRKPAMLVALAFDPLQAAGTLGAESLVSRTEVPNRDDLTAVTYEASLDRLFVIADSKDRLAMLKVTGEEQAEIVLPGVQQEGLSFDAQGNLWIADDQAGLLVFRGTRDRIDAEMKAPHPDASPSDNPS
ncbi:MAG: SdiA-regulated domain-containing protein [Vicinamibacteria bacterium]|nr:SdiA-regulated domain-containing protein [Vicinamibacteria bacterium]